MVLARFLPRNERFFDYFGDAAINAREVADLLVEMLENYEDVERKVRRMRELERRGDEITHQIFNALNRTFVTPLDREDISNLASRIDDFVDYVEETARRMWLYRIEAPTESARLLARIISEQAVLIGEAIPFLSNLKESDKLLRVVVDINHLEDEADDILNNALAVLYDDATDIPTLIKAIRWGELYQNLEVATDRGEDVANTLEGIVLKNA
jgi:predicted phosphate transport protein (TIGR00153 family)